MTEGMDGPTERAAKILVLSEDLRRVEEEGDKLRAELRRNLEGLDRCAAQRRELEKLIAALTEEGGS